MPLTFNRRCWSAFGAVLLVTAGCSRPPEVSPEPQPAPQPSAVVTVSPGKTIGLPRLPGAAKFNIEQIADTPSPIIHQPVPVAAGASVTFLGWAVDESQKAPAGGVDVLVDGMPYAAEYGTARPDVADYFKIPGYKDSGFRFTLPASKIEKGQHQVALRVLTADGKAFHDGGAITFEVR